MNGCVNITASRIGTPLSFNAGLIESPVAISAKREGQPLSFGVTRVGKDADIQANRIGQALQFSAGLVCSLSAGLHLRVEPEYVWLLPENDFSEDVVVYANVSWTIE